MKYTSQIYDIDPYDWFCAPWSHKYIYKEDLYIYINLIQNMNKNYNSISYTKITLLRVKRCLETKCVYFANCGKYAEY